MDSLGLSRVDLSGQGNLWIGMNLWIQVKNSDCLQVSAPGGVGIGVRVCLLGGWLSIARNGSPRPALEQIDRRVFKPVRPVWKPGAPFAPEKAPFRNGAPRLETGRTGLQTGRPVWKRGGPVCKRGARFPNGAFSQTVLLLLQVPGLQTGLPFLGCKPVQPGLQTGPPIVNSSDSHNSKCEFS